MKYRREIDGLRALAVLPVVLFHAGFAPFSGGFVGVDIFFVISGYLITTIILSEKELDNFSIIRFYERRARRILPALFFVMTCCCPFAWLWLLPSQLKDFSQSLVAVSVFSSNILFWEESGYFATASELKPLLHTWSLAVEEQYYLIFPLFIMLLWRLRKRWVVGSLLVGAIASLVLAQWGAYHKPSAAFYLLPARGWELAIGALIAFYFVYKKRHENLVSSSTLASESFGFLGLALVLYSIFFFDKETPFPGLFALIPTLGTGLIIAFASPQTIVGRLLGAKVMVGIGLVSYSAYLWHQPLFVFVRHGYLANPSTSVLLALSTLSFVLAFFSWKYVEIPFRNAELFGRKRIFLIAAIGSFSFIAIGLVGHYNQGFAGRFNIPSSIIESFQRPERAELFGKEGVHFKDDWYLDLGDTDREKSFVVFGDSHASSLLDAFDSSALNAGMSGIMTGASGCTPLLGVYALRKDQEERNCKELNDRVYDYVKQHEIKKIFFVARWSYYTDGGYEGDDFSFIGLSTGDEKSKEMSRIAFKYGVGRTAEAYRRIGVTPIVLSQVPQQLFEPEESYLKASAGEDPGSVLTMLSVPKRRHRELQAYVSKILGSHSEFNIINTEEVFCDDDLCQIGTVEGSFYYDNDHLSKTGAELLVPTLEETLKQNLDNNSR